MSREVLSSLLLSSIIRTGTNVNNGNSSSTPPSENTNNTTTTDTDDDNKLAIVDVRDSDHVGGHIITSTWIPSSTLDFRIRELVRTLRDKDTVVFHCALSQQRGPAAALRYARERERLLGADEVQKSTQRIYVLDGGFVKWQEIYGPDERLTEAWAEDIWKEY